MFRKSLILLAFCLSALTSWGQFPKYEVRAVWLTTLKSLDWPSVKATTPESIERQKQQLRTILDQLGRTHVNTVLLQTRIRATTIYPSQYEPWDACLTGKGGRSPGYDPLQFAIDECHKRGMELHAWVVAIPVGKWNDIGCKQLRERYPKMLMKLGDEGYMNPENAQTGQYIAKICREIVENYDVDGIHLDYIRYPENMKLRVSRDQGRESITNIVRSIHNSIKDVKPWVKLSCSPIGKYSDLTRHSSRGWNAYDKVCQDAQGWLREGLMDQLYPMMYFKDDQFYPFAVDWASNTYGRTVAPGLGIWLLSRSEGSNWALSDITRELNVLRELGMGHTYFRSRFFTDNTKGIYSYVERHLDVYPSLPPPMTWESEVRPSRPADLKLSWEGSRLRLFWKEVSTPTGTPGILYNVYASNETPVDINDVRNLVAKRLSSPTLTIDGEDGRHYFAVTSLDRYGNESDALQSHQPVRPSIEWLPNDGKQLPLPEIDPSIDYSYVSVVSLAGTTMLIRPVSGESLNIRRLPEGVYSLHVVDKKKKSRRIGQFIVKRH
ncbi:MAG: family 10 glycosylhydrolase [Prevotella sp.]|nr:family 10 glycosylhydrolase [Prevotella sp.]